MEVGEVQFHYRFHLFSMALCCCNVYLVLARFQNADFGMSRYEAVQSTKYLGPDLYPSHYLDWCCLQLYGERAARAIASWTPLPKSFTTPPTSIEQ